MATLVEQELIALKELPSINLSDPCVDKQISCEEDHVVKIRLKDRAWRDSEVDVLKKVETPRGFCEDFIACKVCTQSSYLFFPGPERVEAAITIPVLQHSNG